METEELLRSNLNTERETSNEFKNIYDRLLRHCGVLGVTVLTCGELYKSNYPCRKAKATIRNWLPLTNRLDRCLKDLDFADFFITLQVSTKYHDVVIISGEMMKDPTMCFSIIVDQRCPWSIEPEVDKSCPVHNEVHAGTTHKEVIVKTTQKEFTEETTQKKDPREFVSNFNSILKFRKVIGEDPSVHSPENDWLFDDSTRAKEYKELEKINDIIPGLGISKGRDEIQFFCNFLSRCQVSQPNPETGKCKWTWQGKPSVDDFDQPNKLTVYMAKEFSKINKEVERSVSEINLLIEKSGLIEDEDKEEVRGRIQKQKKKILMAKMELLRKRRYDNKWKRQSRRRRFINVGKEKTIHDSD